MKLSPARCGVLLSGALLGELALVIIAKPFSNFAAAGNSLRFAPLLLGAGACFLVAFFLFSHVRVRWPAAVLWTMAIVLRLAMLAMTPGDDFWRYIWEGRVQQHSFNPYLMSPDAPALAQLRDATWSLINHRETPAIYPPAAELTFAAIARFSDSPLAFKSVFIAVDLLTIWLLLRLSGDGDKWRIAAAYAWNPAVAYVSAGGGHFDSLMVCSLTAAMLPLHRLSRGGLSPKAAWSHAVASAALLGLAIAFKLIPVFLIPIWIFALGSRSAVLAITAAIPALLALPFGGPAIVLEPLQAFADVTRFNDLFWWLVELVSVPNPWQRNWPFTMVLILATLALAWRFRADWSRAALWVLGAALILSPVLHPWYVTWILPLACWRQQHAWTVLSLSALCAFLLWDSTAFWTAWQPNTATRGLVILPPLAWFLFSKHRTSNIEHRASNGAATVAES